MKEKMKNKKIFLVVLLLVVVGLGIYFYKKSREDVVTFKEFQVSRGDIFHTILATGNVQPKNRLQIKAPVSGRIETILVQEGEEIKKGQILAWMSSTERAAMLDAASGQGPEAYKKWSELYLATPVLAPISGTLILRYVEPGQTFTSSDAILVISDRLTVKAQVDETDISRIKLKEKAIIMLDAYPDNKLPAHVDKIAFDSTTMNSVTTYLVDVIPESTPSFMRSGMTANVSFYIDLRKDAVLMPSEALKVVNGKTMVLLKTPENRNGIMREISTGISDGKNTEVLSGLKEGDIVLVSEFKLGNKKNESSPFGMPGRPPGGRGGKK